MRWCALKGGAVGCAFLEGYLRVLRCDGVWDSLSSQEVRTLLRILGEGGGGYLGYLPVLRALPGGKSWCYRWLCMSLALLSLDSG